MSKTHDFSFAGGFPVTQEMFDWMQTGWTEQFTAICSQFTDADLAKGVLLGGLVVTPLTGDDVAVSAGWIMAKGPGEDPVILRVPATASVTVGAGNKLMVERVKVFTDVTYDDGSTHHAMVDVFGRTNSFPVAHSTADGYFMNLSDMVRYPEAMGHIARAGNFTEIEMDGSGIGGLVGSLYWRRDIASNTVQIKGNLKVADTASLSGLPTRTVVTVGTMDVSVSAAAPFWGNVSTGGTTFVKDAATLAYLRHIELIVELDTISIIPLPTEGDVPYTVYVNTVIPLD